MDAEEYINIQDAADRFKVSRVTMWRVIRNAKLPIYTSAVDRRERLVKISDLVPLFQPQLLDEGKEAA